METFTTFEGRIGRKSFWIGILLLILAAFVLGAVLNIILGGMFGTGGASMAWVLLYLVLLYPGLAIGIKRLHDRNKSVVPWAIILFGPGVLLQIMQVLGIGFVQTEFAGEVFMMPDAVGGIVTALAAIVGIWALIELGFLKGTTGPNAYGSDPLQQ